MCSNIENITNALLDQIILDLAPFFSINALAMQKRVMRHGMSNLREFKVMCYASCMVKINHY